MQPPKGIVGVTHVRIRVSKDFEGPTETIRVLVDTGADFTMVPRRVLVKLGIAPRGVTEVELGDGRVVERETGIAHVRYRDDVTPTWVLFGERGDASVLGALTLEELRLQVDPRYHTLRKRKRALLASAVPA